MSVRCETVGKYILPIFRSLVAKELIYTYHLTQVEAAQRLGTTQAAISQYINSKRATKSINQFSDKLPNVHAAAKKTAKRLANQEINWEQVTKDFCEICYSCYKKTADYEDSDYAI